MPLAQLIANFVQQRMNLNNSNEIYEWRPINEKLFTARHFY
jgi:hypothetical protein